MSTEQDFYPENAQDLNFESARKTAEANAAVDASTLSVGETGEAVTEAPAVEVTETPEVA